MKPGAITAAFIAVGVRAVVKKSDENQSNIQDARTTGISAKECTNLKNAAAHAGVSGDDFAKAITGVSRALDNYGKQNQQ